MKSLYQWQSIKDFASKAAENVVRLAALLHLFNGLTGEIATEQIEQATEIIHWHLLESKAILGSNPQTTQQQDAQKLLQWLVEKELYEVAPRYLLQYGPLRNKKQRDKAIEILLQTYHLKETTQNNKTLLLINPYVFTDN